MTRTRLAVTAGIITPAFLQVRHSGHHHQGQGEDSNERTKVLESLHAGFKLQINASNIQELVLGIDSHLWI